MPLLDRRITIVFPTVKNGEPVAPFRRETVWALLGADNTQFAVIESQFLLSEQRRTYTIRWRADLANFTGNISLVAVEADDGLTYQIQSASEAGRKRWILISCLRSTRQSPNAEEAAA